MDIRALLGALFFITSRTFRLIKEDMKMQLDSDWHPFKRWSKSDSLLNINDYTLQKKSFNWYGESLSNDIHPKTHIEWIFFYLPRKRSRYNWWYLFVMCVCVSNHHKKGLLAKRTVHRYVNAQAFSFFNVLQPYWIWGVFSTSTQYRTC